MIRSTMRTLLRRRLNDSSGDNWTNVELNELLNEGLHLIQKEVLKFLPDAFMHVYHGPVTIADEFYPLPDGFWYELSVGIRSSSSATTFGIVTRGNYDRDRGNAAGTTPGYDIRGRFIVFMPRFSFDHASGFELQFVPTLSMSSDALAPEIHQGLHLGVVVQSQLIALGETIESPTPAAEQLKRIIDDIPLFYQRGGEAQVLRLDASQALSPGTWIRGTGIDNR
jgi:hypothetical protein